jgi:hypothetical protein
MRRRSAVIVIAATGAAGMLAGCGGSSSPSSSSSTAAATATQAAAAATTAASTPTAAATKDASSSSSKITPLGTTLKVGEPAVIAYTDSTNHKKSTIELTPKSIEKGSLDDFKNIQLDADQKKSTPYYAHISVKNVGSGDLSGASPATYINGIDDRGQDQNEVIFFGSFDRCDDSAPKSLKPGSSYDACLAYLLPGGGALTGFHWIQFDQKSGKSDLNWK